MKRRDAWCEPTDLLVNGVTVVAHPSLAPDPQPLRVLSRLSRSGILAAPPVALPDLHSKPALETPSSVATATSDSLILGLSSPSPNCGMALARTNLGVDDLDDLAVDALFGELGRRLPLKPSSPALSASEMVDVLIRGAGAAVERYDLDPSTLLHMDQQGNALPPDVDPEHVLQAVPSVLHEVGRRRFQRVGKGNHFLELQVIDEVCNRTVAQAWGVEQNQLVVMYHADSDYVGAFVGRTYSHRRKNNWKGRIYEWRVKLPFYLTTGSLGRIPHRFYYYAVPRRWMPIPSSSEEGQRTLVALQAASNYAYANRLAVLAAFRDAMQAVWGMQNAAVSLLWDAPHNGIRQETVGERELWVHRHNAARAEPPSHIRSGSTFAGTGQPVLLPGTDRSSSFLCMAGEGTLKTLHSIDHGTGHSSLQLGRPRGDGTATRLYTYENGLTDLHPHLSDDGIDAVLEALQHYDIARPVARLRPVAVLKGQS